MLFSRVYSFLLRDQIFRFESIHQKFITGNIFSKEYIYPVLDMLLNLVSQIVFFFSLSLSQDTGLRERHLVKGDPITSTNHQLHEFSEHIREELAISSGSYEYLCTCATIPHDLQQFSPLHQFRGLRQYPKRGM